MQGKVTSAGDPLPDWAKSGRFVFMGLSGGPLEAEKGLRSGWDGFTRDDPRGNVQSTREFYNPENLQIPLTAGANWVYCIWSNGWTRERSRQEQWPQAARFMEECRKRGIHTTVYLSAANMFWEDYLQRHPESRRWMETREPAYIRHYGGSPYRVMADLHSREWRNEIKASIDTALDAGAEGFWVDNLFSWHGEALVADFMNEMRTHAARRKSDLIWHINSNSGIYRWGRLGNVLGSEDGRAPVYDAHADPPIRSNLGLLSILSGLRENWRSAELAHYGNDMSAEVRQLLIAECWAYQTGCAWFPFDRAMRTDLHRRVPGAWKVLEAMGTYYKHQLRHSTWFEDGDPLTRVAVLGQSAEAKVVSMLDRMAAARLPAEVVYEDRLYPAPLNKFSVLVIADPEHMAADVTQALMKFRGTLIRAGSSVDLMAEIARRAGPPSIQSHAPAWILHRGIAQSGRIVVHLLNYSMRTSPPFKLSWRGTAQRAEILIPEVGKPQPIPVRFEAGACTVEIPEFPIHAAVSFYS